MSALVKSKTMRRQERKNRPHALCKRGGASGGGGGSTGRTNVRDAPDTMGEAKTLAAKVDLMDVFDDVEAIAPNLKVQEANNLIRQALNLGPNKEIPEIVTNTEASKIIRMIALKSRFNIRDSDLKHYLDY